MSKVERKYFKWNSEKADFEVNLGDSKDTLLSKSLIIEFEEDSEACFSGVEGSPWRINFRNNEVSGIWLNRGNSFKVNETEIIGEHYESVKSILETNFVSISSEIQSVEEMKLYEGSDVLYVITTDGFIYMVGILEK